jgi:hypothetical protein
MLWAAVVEVVEGEPATHGGQSDDQTTATAERTAFGPTCNRVYSRTRNRNRRGGRTGARIYYLEDGPSGHLAEENGSAGVDDLELQVDGGGGVPQGGIELDIEMTKGGGDIAPDGDLPQIGDYRGGEQVDVDIAGRGVEAGRVPSDVYGGA